MPTLADIARRLAADPLAWPVRPCFDAEERWYNRIAQGTHHEAWLLTWLPGQGTDLHDHGGSAGAFVVVEGELTEATVTGQWLEGERLVERRLPPGRPRAFGARHVHRVRNAGPVPAVSVHVYSPALERMRRYELKRGVLRRVQVERAGRDW